MSHRVLVSQAVYRQNESPSISKSSSFIDKMSHRELVSQAVIPTE